MQGATIVRQKERRKSMETGRGDDDRRLFEDMADKGGLCELVNKHDSNQAKLYATLSKLLSTGLLDTKEAIDVIDFHAGRLTKSWMDIIERLASDYGVTSPEFINAASTAWISDEKRRAISLNTLSPEADIRPLLDGSVDRIREKVQETVNVCVDNKQNDPINKTVASNMALAYANFLETDLDAFIGSLKASNLTDMRATVEDASTRPVLGRLIARIGRQAGVAMTIAAGVAGGIIIGSRFGKK